MQGRHTNARVYRAPLDRLRRWTAILTLTLYVSGCSSFRPVAPPAADGTAGTSLRDVVSEGERVVVRLTSGEEVSGYAREVSSDSLHIGSTQGERRLSLGEIQELRVERLSYVRTGLLVAGIAAVLYVAYGVFVLSSIEFGEMF